MSLLKIELFMTDIFTYGSLMCPQIMGAVCGFNAESEPVRLLGYRRFAVLDEDYPGLIECAGADTDGVLYRNISEEGLRRLDVFEGDYYQRQNVVVSHGTSGTVAAQTYVFRSEYCHLLAQWPWSFEHFLNVGKEKFTSAYLGFQKLPNQ
jgi:gamma-glutamylcyclotransferase (GGCT)/AIG2-like uncharacterized protein YtfP